MLRLPKYAASCARKRNPRSTHAGGKLPAESWCSGQKPGQRGWMLRPGMPNRVAIGFSLRSAPSSPAPVGCRCQTRPRMLAGVPLPCHSECHGNTGPGIISRLRCSAIPRWLPVSLKGGSQPSSDPRPLNLVWITPWGFPPGPTPLKAMLPRAGRFQAVLMLQLLRKLSPGKIPIPEPSQQVLSPGRLSHVSSLRSFGHRSRCPRF